MVGLVKMEVAMNYNPKKFDEAIKAAGSSENLSKEVYRLTRGRIHFTYATYTRWAQMDSKGPTSLAWNQLEPVLEKIIKKSAV